MEPGGSPPETSPRATAGLRKSLAFRDVFLFLVTAGVNLQWVATAAAAGPSVMVVWFVGLFTMTVPLSWCTIRLAAQHPDEGGLYVWSRKAFGEAGGFLCGWIYWMTNLPYFPGVLYFAAGNGLFLAGDRFRHLSSDRGYFIVFSLCALALATWMNLVGLSVAKRLNNLGAHARWVGGLLLIGLGAAAYARFGSQTPFDRAHLTPALDLQGLVFWSTIAFALTGLESVSFMGDEIHDARRVVPRAIAAAVPIIFIIYYLGTAAVLVALPLGEVSGLQGVIEAVAAIETRLGLHGVTRLMAGILLVHSLGSVGAWLGAVARIPYVAGIDRFLPKGFATLHPRWGTPHVALLTQAVVTVVFILIGQAGTSVAGAYEVLVGMMVVIYMLPFLFLYGAALRLPLDDRPVRRAVTRGLALLGILTVTAAIGLAMVPAAHEPNKALAVFKIAGSTAVMVGSGVLVYLFRRPRSLRSPGAGA
jgi:amino acid transporter